MRWSCAHWCTAAAEEAECGLTSRSSRASFRVTGATTMCHCLWFYLPHFHLFFEKSGVPKLSSKLRLRGDLHCHIAFLNPPIHSLSLFMRCASLCSNTFSNGILLLKILPSIARSLPVILVFSNVSQNSDQNLSLKLLRASHSIPQQRALENLFSSYSCSQSASALSICKLLSLC